MFFEVFSAHCNIFNNIEATHFFGDYFKMAAPLEICSHVEQRAVIRFLLSEGVRPSEIL